MWVGELTTTVHNEITFVTITTCTSFIVRHYFYTKMPQRHFVLVQTSQVYTVYTTIRAVNVRHLRESIKHCTLSRLPGLVSTAEIVGHLRLLREFPKTCSSTIKRRADWEEILTPVLSPPTNKTDSRVNMVARYTDDYYSSRTGTASLSISCHKTAYGIRRYVPGLT